MKKFATIFFGIKAVDVNSVNDRRYRHVSKVIIHEDYKVDSKYRVGPRIF